MFDLGLEGGDAGFEPVDLLQAVRMIIARRNWSWMLMVCRVLCRLNWVSRATGVGGCSVTWANSILSVVSTS